MFDRSSKFRSCYDSFKSLKDDFAGVPMMALTATLTDSQLANLATNYLRSPVLIRGSFNKKNTNLNVEQYQRVHRREGDDMWDDVPRTLAHTIQDDYATVNMDFKVDVERLAKGLIKSGLKDVKAYHGGIPSDMKNKVDSDF